MDFVENVVKAYFRAFAPLSLLMKSTETFNAQIGIMNKGVQMK